jgi:hypothetical protein
MKRLKLYYCFLLLLVVSSCAKDEDFPVAKPYPLVKTVSVLTDSVSVSVKGEIMLSGSANITEYGFIYTPTSDKYKKSYKKIVTAPAKTGTYRIKFTDNILKNIHYNIQAYAITDGYTVYGNMLGFTGGSTSTPVITDFEPKQGFDGTLITITGENFSEEKDLVKVKIGDTNATVVEVTTNKITIKSPTVAYLGSFPITITVHDKQVNTKDNFTIIGPKLTHLSSNTAKPGEEITIFGEHLSQPFTKGYIDVMIGGKRATITTRNEKEIKVIVPEFPASSYDNALTVAVTAWNKPTVLSYVLTIPSGFKIASVAPSNLGTLYARMPSFVANNKAYLFTLDHFISYDIASNSWVKESTFPGLKRSGAVIAQVGSKAYMLGGGESTFRYYNDVWEYDIQTNTWKQKPNLPFGVFGATSFVLNNKIYFFGGLNNSNTRTLWQYNPETGETTGLQQFPASVGNGSGSTFIHNNKVYAIVSSILWGYNAGQDTWLNLGNAPSNGIAYTMNNQGYVISPYNSIGLSRYNAESNKWDIIAYYPGCITTSAFTGFTHNNRIYLASFSCSLNVYYYEVP